MAAFGDYILVMSFEDVRGLKSSVSIDLDVPTGIDRGTEMNSALGLADDIVADYKAVTSAGMTNAYLRFQDTGATPWANTVAAAGSDISDEAVISTLLLPGDPAAEDVGPEYWTLRIPSPVAAIFESDLITVDRNNALLQALVNTLAANAHVSDEDKIDVTGYVNGMRRGSWISKARKPRG